VRVKRLDLKTGIAPRLREAWDRYRIPLAITEVHHGCTRDEQLRWFAEVWDAAREVREDGVDLRAVTLWSMFGNVDWRSLLTRRDDVYDVGAFDTRAPEPRPTVIAKAAAAYAGRKSFDHPVLDLPGWWRRPERLYPWHGRCKSLGDEGRRLLITGATGTLGGAFGRIAEHRGLPFCLTSRAELDICDAGSIAAAIREYRPWAVINTAGFVRVPDAEREQEACFRANTEGAALLARACADAGIPLVTFSSDLVFDGSLGRPYVEDDEPDPACVYGESKVRAERQVLEADPQALVIRTSAFFGPWDRYNFAWSVVERLSRGETMEACPSTQVSPTFVPDLCHATLDLLIDGEKGIWHLANPGQLSWHAFACHVAEAAGLDTSMVLAAGADHSLVTALGSKRGLLLRPVEQAIADYAAQLPEIEEELIAQIQIAAE
jgi:dTDP-4-dehydrorhamnose reductase